MAGDWFPVRDDLYEDIAVIATAAKLHLDEDTVVGKLIRLWSWAQRQTIDGRAPSVTKVWVDRYVGASGFCDALAESGWFVILDDGVQIPKFDVWMSQGAKVRLLNARRQKKSRAQKVTPVSRSARDKSATTVQDRTEQLKTPPTPAKIPPEFNDKAAELAFYFEERATGFMNDLQRKALPASFAALIEAGHDPAKILADIRRRGKGVNRAETFNMWMVGFMKANPASTTAADEAEAEHFRRTMAEQNERARKREQQEAQRLAERKENDGTFKRAQSIGDYLNGDGKKGAPGHN